MSADWKRVGQAIAEIGLPLLGGVVAGPAGASLGTMIAGTINGDPTKTEEMVKIIKTDPQAAVALQKLQSDTQVELQKLTTQQALAEIQASVDNTSTVNETMRAELLATDNFRGRWRPLFGYAVAVTWVVQTIAICGLIAYSLVKRPDKVGVIMLGMSDLMGPLAVMWSVALGVLGVNIRQRSNDKARALGVQPTGLLDLIKRQ